jgi:hypothetical protein
MIAYRFRPSYAGVPLAITALAAELGRTVLRHEPARGNGAQLSDRGQTARAWTLTVELGGSAEAITQAIERLYALRGAGEARTFVHPILGDIQARLEGFSENLGPGNTTYTLGLVEDTPFSERRRRERELEDVTLQDVVAAGAALSAATEALAAAEPALAAVVPDPAAAVDAATTWSRGTVQAARIDADVEASASAAGDASDILEARSLGAAYRTATALVEFQGTLQRYGAARKAVARRRVPVTVELDAPLITILSDIFGGERAARINADVARANNIVSLSRVTAGTVLEVPLDGVL